MSTRCDFYAGRGLTAVYLGSIGHDAFVDALAGYFTGVTTREQFDAGLAKVFEAYGEISAKNGWPWPWKDSSVTDTAVAFDDGRVWAAHPDNRWAPIDDFDNPGPDECVFPDMLSAEEGTAEGRLRSSLRHRASLVIGPDRDILSGILLRATTILSLQTLHVFEQDGSFWVPEFLWSYRSARWDLHMLKDTLLDRGDEFLDMLSERRAAFNDEEWDLLTWLLRSPTGDEEVVKLNLTTDLPVHFGQPIPSTWEKELGTPLQYVKLPDSDYWRQGLRLMDLVLARAPSCYAYAIARQIKDFGANDWEDVEEWLTSPRTELGGQSVESASETIEGRALVRKFAFELAFPD